MLKLTILLLTLCCFFTQSDRKQSKRGNKPPVIEKIESTPTSLKSCGPSVGPMYCDKANRNSVTLLVTASDPEGGSLKYTYVATAGEVLGEGNRITWNLAGQKFGTHETKVTVSDPDGGTVTSSIKVQIEYCNVCVIPDPPCPIVVVKSYAEVAHRAEKITFYVEISPGYFQSRPDYLWTVKGGNILKGQHTPKIEVEVTGEISSDVTAAIQVEGCDSACATWASGTVRITP